MIIKRSAYSSKVLLLTVLLGLVNVAHATDQQSTNSLQHNLTALSAAAEKMTQTLMLYNFSQQDPRYADKMDDAKAFYLEQIKLVYDGISLHEISTQAIRNASKKFYGQHKATVSSIRTGSYSQQASQLILTKNTLNTAIGQLSDELVNNNQEITAASLARDQLSSLQLMTEFYMTLHLNLENPNADIDMDESIKAFSQKLEALSQLTAANSQKDIKMMNKKWSFMKRSLGLRGQQGTPEIMYRYSSQVMSTLLRLSQDDPGNKSG